jgi:hypothetical protein
MLRRFVLVAFISGGLTSSALASPVAASPRGIHQGDVYKGEASALFGGWTLSTPSTPLPLVNVNGATAALCGIVLEFSGTNKVTQGTALWVPPNSSFGESAAFTSGSVRNGTVTADGTVDGSRLRVTIAIPGLSQNSVNGPTQTIGTGTITVTVW